MRRRRALLAATGVLTSLAGCAAFSSSPGPLEITLFNHDDSPYDVYFELFRVGEDLARSEARVADPRIHVEPDGDVTRENVAEARPSVVRYGVYRNDNFRTDQDHMHYYPDGDAENHYIAFDVDEEGTLSYRRPA